MTPKTSALPASVALILIAVTAVSATSPVFPDYVTCPTEVYVRVGLEFQQCQMAALKNFTADMQKNRGPKRNVCPMVKTIIEVCAENVKMCFSEKGWERSKQIFLDQLALSMPDVSACELFKAGTDLTEKQPGEACSVAEEVANGREIAQCSQEVQLSMINALVGARRKAMAKNSTLDFRDVFCAHLMKIRNRCLMAKLPKCYDGHTLTAHAAYLLENLKVTASTLAMHLDSKEDTKTSVVDCPAFQDQDLMVDENKYNWNPIKHSYSEGGPSDDGDVNTTLVVVIVVLVAVILCGISVAAAKTYRLGPRLKAVVSRLPYADFVGEGAGAANSRTSNPSNVESAATTAGRPGNASEMQPVP